MENKQKYTVFLSTDGKMTIQFGADHVEEITNTLNKLEGVFNHLVQLAKETSFQTRPKRFGEETTAVQNTRICPIHKVQMKQSLSRRTGKPYFSHTLDGGVLCFGSQLKY